MANVRIRLTEYPLGECGALPSDKAFFGLSHCALNPITPVRTRLVPYVYLCSGRRLTWCHVQRDLQQVLGEQNELVLAGSVCADCVGSLDRRWASSTATDWMLICCQDHALELVPGVSRDRWACILHRLSETRATLG